MSREKSREDKFSMEESQFRSWIEKGTSPSSKGNIYPAEKDRYLLYVSYACPFANRTLIMLNLKGLTNFIDVVVVNPIREGHDWDFNPYPGATKEPVFNAKDLREVYEQVSPNYSGVVSVPVLFDKKTKTIVNNESAEIIRMLNDAFNDSGANSEDFYPASLSKEIDDINERIAEDINLGVYKAGFAKTQDHYMEAVTKLFQALDEIEDHLQDKDYLVGDQLIEADIRLFTTLIRFDAVYYGHFKCNLKAIKDYPNLSAYTRRLYQIPAFKNTIFFDHIKPSYYVSHRDINPTGIVPLGPDLTYIQ